MTQILVTKPGALTAADRKKLRTAGIVTVEADDPQDVRLLGAEGPPLDGSDLALAAFSALAETDPGHAVRHAQELVVKIIAEMLSARDEARRAPC